MACALPYDSGEPDVADISYRLADVWSGAVAVEGRAPFEWVVSTPLTPDGSAFYAQDPGGGPGTGARIELHALAPELPLETGRWMRAELSVLAAEGAPRLALDDADQVEILGRVEPVLAPWAEDPELVYSLVDLGELHITSPPDPAGRADTDGAAPLGGSFAAPPPEYGASGELVGLLDADGRVSPRDAADWQALSDGLPAELSTVAAVRSGEHPTGAWVSLADAVQIAPWSRDGRYTVVQDAAGLGLWVDTDAFAVDRRTEPGQALSWMGEARGQAEGWTLRTWWDPVPVGSGKPIYGVELIDGALVERRILEMREPDAQGRREASGGLLLDDSFVDLDELELPSWITAVVRGSDPPVLHVIDSRPAD